MLYDAAGQADSYESDRAGGFEQQRKEELHAHLCSGHVCLGSLGACSGKNMAFGLMRTGSQSPLSFLAACSWRSYFTLSLDLLLYKIRL